jgi:hypothetical protein
MGVSQKPPSRPREGGIWNRVWNRGMEQGYGIGVWDRGMERQAVAQRCLNTWPASYSKLARPVVWGRGMEQGYGKGAWNKGKQGAVGTGACSVRASFLRRASVRKACVSPWLV